MSIIGDHSPIKVRIIDISRPHAKSSFFCVSASLSWSLFLRQSRNFRRILLPCQPARNPVANEMAMATCNVLSDTSAIFTSVYEYHLKAIFVVRQGLWVDDMRPMCTDSLSRDRLSTECLVVQKVRGDSLKRQFHKCRLLWLYLSSTNSLLILIIICFMSCVFHISTELQNLDRGQ